MQKNIYFANYSFGSGNLKKAFSWLFPNNHDSSDTLLQNFIGFLLVSIAIGIITLLGDSLRKFVEPAGIAMIYMAAVVTCAMTLGLIPSLFASVMSILCYDFFFTEPIYHFEMANGTDVIALVLFGASAVATSQVASHGRTQRKLAERREKVNAGLYLFSRQLCGLTQAEELFALCAQTIGAMLRAQVGIFLEEADRLVLACCFPERETPGAWALQTAKAVWQSGKPLEIVQSEQSGLFLPLRTSRGLSGVFSIQRDPVCALGPQERQLADTLVDLAAVALERIELAAELDRVKLEGAADQLRSAILASLSHDLRSPLTSILGSLSSLQCLGDQLDKAARADLVDTARGEAERLSRFVNNLLDISRLGAGAIKMAISPIDLSDVVATALGRARKILENHQTHIHLPHTLPMPRLDPVLTEQVLFNILDNAAKYSPPGTAIEICGEQRDGAVLLTISDEGMGLPEADVEKIFDRFYRVNPRDGKLTGTGLGLTVCRGFVEAQGGRIFARNRQDGNGSIFTMRFPIPDQGIAQSSLLLEET